MRLLKIYLWNKVNVQYVFGVWVVENDRSEKFAIEYKALLFRLISYAERTLGIKEKNNRFEDFDAEAKDLVMRVYETLHKRSREDNLPEYENLYSYAARCIKNLMIDDGRLLKNKNTVSEQTAFGVDEKNLPRGVDSVEDPLSEIVYSSGNREKDMVQTVKEVLEGLSEDCKNILTLFGQGDSYADISAVLGIPTLTVGSRMARCREHLNSIKDINDYV